jgi:N-methylhydantoinase A
MLRSEFEAAYRRLFKRHIPDSGIEIMSWSVLVSTHTTKPVTIAEAAPGDWATPVSTREVFDAKQAERISVGIHNRLDLTVGQRISGPAIIVEEGTSTLVSSSFDAHVDLGGALVLTQKIER